MTKKRTPMQAQRDRIKKAGGAWLSVPINAPAVAALERLQDAMAWSKVETVNRALEWAADRLGRGYGRSPTLEHLLPAAEERLKIEAARLGLNYSQSSSKGRSDRSGK